MDGRTVPVVQSGTEGIEVILRARGAIVRCGGAGGHERNVEIPSRSLEINSWLPDELT